MRRICWRSYCTSVISYGSSSNFTVTEGILFFIDPILNRWLVRAFFKSKLAEIRSDVNGNIAQDSYRHEFHLRTDLMKINPEIV